MNLSLRAIFRVWMRYFRVFQKSLLYGLVTTFTEPLLYLMAFGFGLGALIDQVSVGGQAVSYRAFVLSGIVAQTLLFQGFFEAAYGSFVRMYYQRIFQAMAVTPITLSEILWGELIWDASKASFSTAAVLLIGVCSGIFQPVGALFLLPLCFLCALLFASLGLTVAALSRTIEEISYPQYLLVFPMFLFCGVFFPIEQLPAFLQPVAALLPLTGIAAGVRFALLGLPLHLWDVVVPLLWLCVLVPFSRRAMRRRLISGS